MTTRQLGSSLVCLPVYVLDACVVSELEARTQFATKFELCVRVCVRACVRVCVRASVYVCICERSCNIL